MRAPVVVALLLAAFPACADECSRLMTHYVQCVNRADDGTIVSIEVVPTNSCRLMAAGPDKSRVRPKWIEDWPLG